MQRLNGWTGVPERLPHGFTMTKPESIQIHVAVCETWTNSDGWELRFVVDGQNLPFTTVVTSADDMQALIETWRAALQGTGWS